MVRAGGSQQAADAEVPEEELAEEAFEEEEAPPPEDEEEEPPPPEDIEDEVPLEDEEVPLEDEEAPLEDEEVPPGDEVPPEDEEVPFEDEEAPLEDEEMPVEGEDVPPEDEEVPPEDEEDAPGWEEMDAEEEADEGQEEGDDMLDEDAEPQADPAEAEHEEPEQSGLPRRESDLSLEEIPDELKEAASAIEGNLELKRALSNQGAAGIEAPAAKRRKLEGGAKAVQVDNPIVMALLKAWHLETDTTAAYILRVAPTESLKLLQSSRWAPSATPTKMSNGRQKTRPEQIYEQLIKLQDQTCQPGGGPVDVVAAFRHRLDLSQGDDDTLCKLSHRSLRYMLREYDRSRPFDEVLDEANAEEAAPAEDSELPAPEKQGLFVLRRNNCLELIDPSCKALVIGDANLTFSLQLALHRKQLCHPGHVVATTFEKLDTLLERYPEIKETVKKLNDNGAEVVHDVDCTRLAVDQRFHDMEEKFGAVYYNFPHAGVVRGFYDGHPFVRWRHANLMHLFFRALRSFVSPGASVKVSSNSRATGVRFSDIIDGARSSEFVHVETLPFVDWQLSGYRRSYGDRRDVDKRPQDGQNYNAQRVNADMVYCFAYRPSGEAVKPARVTHPPTKQEMLLSKQEGKMPGNETLKRKRVEELYDLFMSYVSGIHVG